MKVTKYYVATHACRAEAEHRIGLVIDPYLENLHQMHESGTINILREVKEHLIAEFEDFGFPFVDITSEGNNESNK